MHAHHKTRECGRQVRREVIPECFLGGSALRLRPSWEDLITQFPGLAEFVTELETTYQPKPGFCSTTVWYENVKPRLRLLVPHWSNDHGYADPYVWDAAATYAMRALPNCDHRHQAGCAGYVYADRRGLNGLYLLKSW